jgi:hypothetical protein
MRAAISRSELILCRLLTLNLRTRRWLSEGRSATDFEDLDEDIEEEDEDEELPRAFRAHFVIACSTTAARAPSGPPVRMETEDDDEDETDKEELFIDESRGERGRPPR